MKKPPVKLDVDYVAFSPKQLFTFEAKIEHALHDYSYKQSMWLQLWVKEKPRWLPTRLWYLLLSKLVKLTVEKT